MRLWSKCVHFDIFQEGVYVKLNLFQTFLHKFLHNLIFNFDCTSLRLHMLHFLSWKITIMSEAS